MVNVSEDLERSHQVRVVQALQHIDFGLYPAPHLKVQLIALIDLDCAFLSRLLVNAHLDLCSLDFISIMAHKPLTRVEVFAHYVEIGELPTTVLRSAAFLQVKGPETSQLVLSVSSRGWLPSSLGACLIAPWSA